MIKLTQQEVFMGLAESKLVNTEDMTEWDYRYLLADYDKDEITYYAYLNKRLARWNKIDENKVSNDYWIHRERMVRLGMIERISGTAAVKVLIENIFK